MLVLKDHQKVLVKVAPVSAAGNPAKVDGAVAWMVSDDSVLSVKKLDEFGLEVEVVTTGKVGAAQVKVVADADLGEGVKELVGLLDVEVVAGEAVTMEVTPGVPSDK